MEKFCAEAPNDEENLIAKVAIIMSTYCLGRRGEMAEFTFEEIAFVEEGKYKGCIQLTFLRSKQVGIGGFVTAVDGENQRYSVEKVTRMIGNAVACQFVKDYVEMIPVPLRKGRFFRKLLWNEETESYRACAKRFIGGNTLANSTKIAAKWLKKENWACYTSQGLRALGATTMAENGASEIEICMAGKNFINLL